MTAPYRYIHGIAVSDDGRKREEFCAPVTMPSDIFQCSKLTGKRSRCGTVRLVNVQLTADKPADAFKFSVDGFVLQFMKYETEGWTPTKAV